VARNIVNVRHRITKEPLNLFFLDLEPAPNDKEVYNLTAIQNKLIHIEPTKTTSLNVHAVNTMDTHADTATDHMRVSNVETNTTARTAKKPDTLQQNVLSVVEVIHQTINDVSATTISSETEITTETPRKSKPSTPQK